MRKIFAGLFLSSLTLMLHGGGEQDTSCDGPQHMRVGLRYTTPRGIGYKTGYTTLDAFFAPDFLQDSWLPFLDLRGHVMDNGTLACNVGVGFRYLDTSWIYGVNAYYDYRHASHHNFNQVAAGLEALSSFVDLRINGYLPVASSRGPYYSTEFYSLYQNSLFVKQLRDFSLGGSNAEIGFHFDQNPAAPIYFAIGPYYLRGYRKATWGGEARARVDICNQYVRLEASTAYDHLFKWTGQGQISINIPFGAKSTLVRKKDNLCEMTKTLSMRAVQPIDREEIIPVSTKTIVSTALDPSSGDPYYFIFVDNTSSSLGTYESPYPTLAEAEDASSPGDIIYVFPGDGTTTGMDQGITLQDSQMFLGASIDYSFDTTVGTITLPAQAATPPTITNTSGNAVLIADNNTVSGFTIQNATSNGIYGESFQNLYASQNTFIGNETSGIELYYPIGNISLDSNTFTYGDYGLYLESDSDTAVNTFSVTNCTFNQNTYAYYTELEGGTFDTITFSDCTFNLNSYDMYIDTINSDTTVGTVNIANCDFYGIGNDDPYAIYFSLASSTINEFNITGNYINNYYYTIYPYLENYALLNTMNITNNELINCYYGHYIDLSGAANTATLGTLTIANNTFTNNYDAIQTYVQENCTIGTLDIANNIFTSCEYGFDVELSSSGALDTMNITNNSFTFGSYDIEISTAGTSTLGSVTISDNTSHACIDYSIEYQSTSSNASVVSMQASNNQFVAYESPTPENHFAAIFQVSNGHLCLQFTDNVATTPTDAYAYRYEQSGSGVFNVTTGSDNTTNIGAFQAPVGTIGECTN